MDLILYHGSCPDGWCAAYIAQKRYLEAQLRGLTHGQNYTGVITECMNRDVLMVDFSFPTRELNDSLAKIAKSFRILDHHKTAQAVLEGASYATFDMRRSGAGLAWDYLFGKDSFAGDAATHFPQSRPWWVDYTEDQDLWNWALPESQPINAFLMVQPRTIEAWDSIVRMSAENACFKGEGVRQYIEYYTRSVLELVELGVLDGHSTGVLNIPYVGVSEAGNAIVKLGYDVALAWHESNGGRIKFSLRSNKEGANVDVSAIAKKFGGGGHQNAAGFELHIEAGRRLVDQVLRRDRHAPIARCC